MSKLLIMFSDCYKIRNISLIFTGNCHISSILVSGDLPRLLRTSAYTQPISGTLYNNFSIKTFPMRPRAPVTNTFLPLYHSFTSDAILKSEKNYPHFERHIFLNTQIFYCFSGMYFYINRVY